MPHNFAAQCASTVTAEECAVPLIVRRHCGKDRLLPRYVRRDCGTKLHPEHPGTSKMPDISEVKHPEQRPPVAAICAAGLRHVAVPRLRILWQGFVLHQSCHANVRPDPRLMDIPSGAGPGRRARCWRGRGRGGGGGDGGRVCVLKVPRCLRLPLMRGCSVDWSARAGNPPRGGAQQMGAANNGTVCSLSKRANEQLATFSRENPHGDVAGECEAVGPWGAPGANYIPLGPGAAIRDQAWSPSTCLRRRHFG
eukprot:gene2196-biopygen22975